MTSQSRRRAATITLIGGYVNVGLVAASGFILIPLYLQHIGARLYGAWAGSGDLLGWLGVLEMGVSSLSTQRIADAYGKNEHQSVGRYYSTGLITILPLMVLFTLIAAILAASVPQWMNISADEAWVLSVNFVLAAIATSLLILNNTVSALPSALQQTAFINASLTVATIIRLIVTTVLLLAGYGLFAISIGLLIGNGLLLLANTIYALRLYRQKINTPLRPNRAIFREFMTLSPAIFLGNVGNAVMSRSATALIAIFLKPELATIYVITRRAADMIELLIDRFGGAVFAGFAHLVGSDQRARAAQVHSEIMNLYSSVSIFLIAAYIALNQTLVHVWTGSDQFGGQILTILIGLNVLTKNRASLLTFLYSAMGRIARGTLLIFLESLIRLPLMIVFLLLVGLPGIPLIAFATALVVGFIVTHLTSIDLQAPLDLFEWKYLPAYVFILGSSSVIGSFIWSDTWLQFILTASVISVVILAGLSVLDPVLLNYEQRLLKRLRGLIRQTSV